MPDGPNPTVPSQPGNINSVERSTPLDMVNDSTQLAVDIVQSNNIQRQIFNRRNSIEDGAQNENLDIAAATKSAEKLIEKDKFAQHRENENIKIQKELITKHANVLQAKQKLESQMTGLSAAANTGNAKKYVPAAGMAVADHFASVPLGGVKPFAVANAVIVTKQAYNKIGRLEEISKIQGITDNQAATVNFIQKQQLKKIKNVSLNTHVVTGTANTVFKTGKYVVKKIVGIQGQLREEHAAQLVQGVKNNNPIATTILNVLDSDNVQNVKEGPTDASVALVKGLMTT